LITSGGTIKFLCSYYGTYSNASREKRKKEEHKKDVIRKSEFVEVAPPPISKELKRRWFYFIQKVYETDPLIYPIARETRLKPGIGSTPAAVHTGPPVSCPETRRTQFNSSLIES